MSWEVILGITALIGAAISIYTVVANNTKALTKVECAISTLNTVVEVQAKHICDQDIKLGEHETRLTVLETKKEDK